MRGCCGRSCRRHPLGAFGGVVLLVIVVAAVGAPYLAPFDPIGGDSAALYSPPNATYWLGTDGFGRDILSRLIYGARISLLVGLGASLLGVGGRRDVRHLRRLSSAAGPTDRAARHGRHAGVSDAAAGAGDGDGARAVAAQRHHRAGDADRAARGPHRARQHAGA